MVIIGSGFGGLWATEGLKKAPVDVIMISGTSPPVSAAALPGCDRCLVRRRGRSGTREVLKKQRNATVLLGRVTDIDIDAKTVTSVIRWGPP